MKFPSGDVEDILDLRGGDYGMNGSVGEERKDGTDVLSGEVGLVKGRLTTF